MMCQCWHDVFYSHFCDYADNLVQSAPTVKHSNKLIVLLITVHCEFYVNLDVMQHIIKPCIHRPDFP